jgi:glycosyltransferase involved in cell wall biosynthesis
MLSIITPSYNQLPYLRRCCASVADQNSDHEHIIIDGGSTDGTAEWLHQQPALHWISEPDQGMYDAINKGIALAKGNLVAYLNCDEQYLPETLAAVESAFARRPDVDIVYGDALLIHPDGTLAAFRKTYPLRWSYVSTSHLYALSCATFFRRPLLSRCGGYNIAWRTVGDTDLILRALREGARPLRLPRYLSTFTIRGANLGATPLAKAEAQNLNSQSPWWLRATRPFLNACRLTEKTLHGAYRQSWPLDYSVYTDSGHERTIISAHSGSFRWKS